MEGNETWGNDKLHLAVNLLGCLFVNTLWARSVIKQDTDGSVDFVWYLINCVCVYNTKPILSQSTSLLIWALCITYNNTDQKGFFVYLEYQWSNVKFLVI